MKTASSASLCAALVLLAGCSTPPPLPTTNPADLKSPRPGFVPGYLPDKSWVDSLALLPPPPAAGSAQLAADEANAKAQRAAPGSARWALAASDAVLSFPAASGAFECALGVPINASATPHLNMLLRRTLADAGLATYRAKDQYKRERPFMLNGLPTCTPQEETALRKDGSYPSGHAALGWAWALALTQVAPERANALAQRGRAFGESRAACGVHWPSDVEAGQLVASVVFAQLQSNADYLAQVDAARKEVAAARAGGAKVPAAQCAAETAALPGARTTN